jgi:magnesium transporter
MVKIDFTRNARQRSKQRSRVDYYYKEVGTQPGKLDFHGNNSPPKISIIDYDSRNIECVNLDDVADIAGYLDTESISWINLDGLGTTETWQALQPILNLHPLAVEDVVNVPQRPKIEAYSDHLVIITMMVVLKQNDHGFSREQIGIVLSKHYLLTVQEEPDYDCFDGLRDRLVKSRGIVRHSGTDYLAFTIIDAIIDAFFPVLEYYGEAIEELEEEVISNPTKYTVAKINNLRRELLALRRSIWPQREAINTLIRDGHDLINEGTIVYLRDCYDRTIQVMDMVETYRELASGLMDAYLSAVSNRMNEIMQFLTVISAIFIPLTFIAGVYGMNFNTEKSRWNMPELAWEWGYPACLLFMFAIALSLTYLFWRRGWLKF